MTPRTRPRDAGTDDLTAQFAAWAAHDRVLGRPDAVDRPSADNARADQPRRPAPDPSQGRGVDEAPGPVGNAEQFVASMRRAGIRPFRSLWRPDDWQDVGRY